MLPGLGRFRHLPYDEHMRAPQKEDISGFFSDNELKTLVVLEGSGRPMIHRDVAEAAGIGPASAHRSLLRLASGGLIAHAGRRETTGGKYGQQYVLTADGTDILAKLESSDRFQGIKRDLA